MRKNLSTRGRGILSSPRLPWYGDTPTLVLIHTPDEHDGISAPGLGSKRWRGRMHSKAPCETKSSEVHGIGSHLSPGDGDIKIRRAAGRQSALNVA